MKKKISLLIFACLLSFLNYAQEHTNDWPSQFSTYTFVSSNPALENGVRLHIGSPRIMQQETNEKEFIHNAIGNTKTKSSTYSYVDWINTDSSGAAFFLSNISPGSSIHYEYRVLENNKKIIKSWTVVSNFIPDFLNESATKQLGDLGVFKTNWGNFINVEIRQKAKPLFLNGDTLIAITGAVLWLQIKPVIKNIYGDDEIKDLFSTVLANQDSPDRKTRLSAIKNKWFDINPAIESDTSSVNSKKLILNDSAENLIFYLQQTGLFYKEMIEYKLIGNDHTIIDWKPNDFDNNLIWLKRLYLAKYRLQIRFSSQRHNVTNYEFEIKFPPKQQTTSFKIIAGSFLVAFFAFIILLLRFLNQKKRLKAEKLKKEKTESELKAIRAQLNPHFIFNSLNSIQGLINNNKTESANKYLSEFAHLMRKTLTEHDKENNNLTDEIKLLAGYLKLEQLRFNFVYSIEIDKAINTSEIEIPSLLLQPIIENAVKHGVSGRAENGIIKISFAKQRQNMLVSVIDNGKGFDSHTMKTGYGLKLTKDRIELINEISGTQAITLDVQCNTTTIVQLTFQNWLG